MRAALAVGAVALGVAIGAAAQSVTYTADFQNVVDGWTGSNLFRTWPDPLNAGNVVYGIRSMRHRAVGPGAPQDASSTYTAQSFSATGFEYRGRFLRTDAQSPFGLTFFSYTLGSKEGIIRLWSDGAGNLAGVTESALTAEANRW